jgi:hypothetical protein
MSREKLQNESSAWNEIIDKSKQIDEMVENEVKCSIFHPSKNRSNATLQNAREVKM